ncbi:MAG TPA: primosomal protein N', partial [Alphaproteobacteria bacterium]|nr:primosomal protein N' [Alphaproteobacteria bacterium]
LFLPYQELGLIIVDEEHDPAYKQEEGVIYHARDMAVVRANLGAFPIVMVSATPSLETMQNAWQGRYHHLSLPARHGGAALPDIHLIDLKVDKPEDRQHFIAPTLKAAMASTIDRKEQVLLFLNRRGYAPLTLCRTCGHRFQCPRCTAWLIEHRRTGKLHCHHCDHYVRMPEKCPECGEGDSLAACGPGVERILEEVKESFPVARVMVLSSDTATTHDDLRAMLDQIQNYDVDIIIGTQIIAKGHHFPKLTCVGVVDADLGLTGGDLRATERVYQLLHQVAGRAGREDKQGTVYLQTFVPESRVMQALARGERDEFLEIELQEREAANMPPISRLAGIIVSGRDENQVRQAAQALGRVAPQSAKIQTLGPAEAPMYRLRGKFRYRLLVRAEKNIDLQKAIKHWLDAVKTPSTIRVQVDIDPQSFY